MDETPPLLRDYSKKTSGKKWGCFMGFGILALVCLPLWFFFIGPQMRHDRLVEKGVQAPGRLIGVDETGTVVNDAPELELTVEFHRKDGVLDTASTDFVPSLRTLHYYQAGTAVTVAYDPEDPHELTIVSLSTGPSGTSGMPDGINQSVDSLKHIMDSLRQFADSMVKSVQR